MWKHSFIYNLNKAPGMFIIYIYILFNFILCFKITQQKLTINVRMSNIFNACRKHTVRIITTV